MDSIKRYTVLNENSDKVSHNSSDYLDKKPDIEKDGGPLAVVIDHHEKMADHHFSTATRKRNEGDHRQADLHDEAGLAHGDVVDHIERHMDWINYYGDSQHRGKSHAKMTRREIMGKGAVRRSGVADRKSAKLAK